MDASANRPVHFDIFYDAIISFGVNGVHVCIFHLEIGQLQAVTIWKIQSWSDTAAREDISGLLRSVAHNLATGNANVSSRSMPFSSDQGRMGTADELNGGAGQIQECVGANRQ